jgi:hypothetical protein
MLVSELEGIRFKWKKEQIIAKQFLEIMFKIEFIYVTVSKTKPKTRKEILQNSCMLMFPRPTAEECKKHRFSYKEEFKKIECIPKKSVDSLSFNEIIRS